MNLVSFALRRPITILVLVIAVLMTGFLAIERMPRDIFPNLGVPVLYVAQPYGGLDAAQMEGFIVNYFEYHFLYITGIEHVESKSIQGVGLVKLQFQPGTDMAGATAETVSYVNRARAFMPSGTVPPFVLRFDAGSVPVGDLVFSDESGKLGVKDLQDAALFRVRPLFATLPGVSAPPPFGGSPRTVVISADPDRLRAYNMSPDEIVQAIAKGNTISPSGNVRIGNEIPIVPVNSVVTDVARLGDVPIRSDGTRTIFVRDIGTIADSADIEVGYALVNGRRTVYIPVTKRADASTLSVVNLVKQNIPKFQAVLPPGVKVSYEFDQSPFVVRAILGLAEEGLLGAVLTGLMILLFLRDWRSALVVVVNIPLAILAATIALWVAVGFAMVASYALSSTLVPVLLIWVLRTSHGPDASGPSRWDRFQGRYRDFSSRIVRQRWIVVPVYLTVAVLIIVFVGSTLGRAIFPTVDAGQFTLRMRAPAGTRIEETEKLADKTLDIVRREVGPQNIEITLGFVGVQNAAYPINTIYLWTSGPEEAVLQVQLNPQAGIRVADLEERLRQKLPQELPGVRYSFEPSDIVNQVMSFGAPTPIEVAVSGPDFTKTRPFAEQLKKALGEVSSLRDLEFEQELDYPAVRVDIDRALAGMLGVTAGQVGESLTDATSSSRFTVPNFWADPKSGVGYQVQVEVPPPRMDSFEDVKNIPISRNKKVQIDLRNVADVTPGTVLGEIDRYNMQRMLTLAANIGGEDLGGVADRVSQALAKAGEPPQGVNVAVRGQVVPMAQIFSGLELGLFVAVITIFLLLAGNFQSFRLSLAVMLTVPAVVAGVAVALWVSGTTLNIQSLMGAIMAIGVAVANAILLVTFAERDRIGGDRVPDAAVAGAANRLRPILMTSCAMIAGMLPMALGLGEGGSQTAPLGRAVIGGLTGGTIATLIILPAIFAILQGERTRKSASLLPADSARG